MFSSSWCLEWCKVSICSEFQMNLLLLTGNSCLLVGSTIYTLRSQGTKTNACFHWTPHLPSTQEYIPCRAISKFQTTEQLEADGHFLVSASQRNVPFSQQIGKLLFPTSELFWQKANGNFKLLYFEAKQSKRQVLTFCDSNVSGKIFQQLHMDQSFSCWEDNQCSAERNSTYINENTVY